MVRARHKLLYRAPARCLRARLHHLRQHIILFAQRKQYWVAAHMPLAALHAYRFCACVWLRSLLDVFSPRCR